MNFASLGKSSRQGQLVRACFYPKPQSFSYSTTLSCSRAMRREKQISDPPHGSLCYRTIHPQFYRAYRLQVALLPHAPVARTTSTADGKNMTKMTPKVTYLFTLLLVLLAILGGYGCVVNENGMVAIGTSVTKRACSVTIRYQLLNGVCQ